MVECDIRGFAAVNIKRHWVLYRAYRVEVVEVEGILSMVEECLEEVKNNRLVDVTKVNFIGA